MDNRAIGVFDSGLGGLTVVKELMRQMPEEPVVYFGDTGRVPYGTKSDETIIKYTQSDIRFLQTFDIKMLVVACGTASTIALPALKGTLPVPAMGVAEAAAEAAVRATKNKKIGILGTPGTIKSGAYEELICARLSGAQTVSVACPLFVPMVEEGRTDDGAVRLVALEYLEPILLAGADTIILGCTHYPLLSGAIQKIVGRNVTLIDPGRETARAARAFLEEKDLCAGAPASPQYRFFASDSVESFAALSERFLERGIPGGVHKVDIEQYT